MNHAACSMGRVIFLAILAALCVLSVGEASGRLPVSQCRGSHAPLYADAGYETVILPSSSPANARLSFEDKLAHWRAIRRFDPLAGFVAGKTRFH